MSNKAKLTAFAVSTVVFALALPVTAVQAQTANPVIIIADDDRIIVSGETITLDGSSSTVDGGHIIDSYFWQAGTGLTGQGNNASATYEVTADTVTEQTTAAVVFSIATREGPGTFPVADSDTVRVTITINPVMPTEMTMMPVTETPMTETPVTETPVTETPTETETPVTPVVTPAETPAAAAPTRRSSSSSGSGNAVAALVLVGGAWLLNRHNPNARFSAFAAPTGQHAYGLYANWQQSDQLSFGFQHHESGLNVSSESGKDAVNSRSVVTLKYTW